MYWLLLVSTMWLDTYRIVVLLTEGIKLVKG